MEAWGKCHSFALELTSFALTGNEASQGRAETNGETRERERKAE